MALHLIGIGLGDQKDITVRGLELVKKCSKVYLEYYTSFLQCSVEDLEALYGKKIIAADRAAIEQGGDAMVDSAKDEDIAVLIIGDVFGATTHWDMYTRAKEKDIPVEVVHNASILTAIGDTGLQLYKFGRTASIPFPQENWTIEAYYNVLKDNEVHGLHTLFLLDLNPMKEKFLSVNDAIQMLIDLEADKQEELIDFDSTMVACARLGTKTAMIKVGKPKDLMAMDFGKPPHCLIVPGRMHFMEEETLERFR
ncbi:MAG: diphthine synthase [Candidatus Nanoarchaeia archaeon]